MKNETQQQQLMKIRETIESQPASIQSIDDVMRFLHESNEAFHWVGVYGLKDAQLHVGPYYGPETDHRIIPVGRGVCGTAVEQNKNQIVDDVKNIENYLACNLETRSEIVVLIRDPDGSGRVLGQIDVDGKQTGLFNTQEAWFEEVAVLLGPSMKIFQESL